jgi:hypothetical protein
MQKLTGTRVFHYAQLIEFAMHRLTIFIPSASRYNIQLPPKPVHTTHQLYSPAQGWTYETHISPSR